MVKPTPLRAPDPEDGTPGLLRVPPHNIEAERALLGAILLNNRALDKVSDFLLSSHFTEAVNGRIFASMTKLIALGQQANPVTLKTYLERDELMIAAGGMKYLASLSNSMVTLINSGDYGRLIYDLYLRREVISLCSDMIDAAFDPQIEETAKDQIEDGLSRFGELLTDTQTGGGLMPISRGVARALERHRLIDQGIVGGLSTGLIGLDSAMGLLEDGDLIIIAGRPSMGKTALAQTVMTHVAAHFRALAERENKRARHVAYFSAEMTEMENAERAIAAGTGVVSTRQRRAPGQLDPEKWAQLVAFESSIQDLPVLIDERSSPTLSRIRAECRSLQRRGGVGLVVVDYLQIMGIERGIRMENRTQAVGYLANGLKALAKDLNCPVVALSQLSRGVEGREDKRPGLADLRESGDIEAAADIVGFCYRDQYYLEKSEPKRLPSDTDEKFHDKRVKWQTMLGEAHGKAEVIIGKARSSKTGMARLRFDGEKTLFTDVDRYADKGPVEEM